MHFEVTCYNWRYYKKFGFERPKMLRREYFNTYTKAIEFKKANDEKFERIDTIPQNWEALCKMRRIEREEANDENK